MKRLNNGLVLLTREEHILTTPQERYDRKNTVQVKLKLNVKTDADIIEYLNKQPNKQGKLKELIRKEIK